MTFSADSIQPNLFIIGAPKCGTTSLYDYLVQYAEVAGGIHKEPHFFNDDQPEFRHADSLDQYLSFFNAVRPDANLKYVIDGSTNYIYSQTAVSNILNFAPDAKFIVMLRHPVDLIRSLHEHFLFKQSEPEQDLARAWELGPIKERAPDFVKRHPYPGHLSYRNAGLLGKNMKSVVEKIPPTNLLIIFFEDLVRDSEYVLDRIMKFLKIERSAEIKFEKRNRAKKMSSKWLNRILFYPPPAIRRLKHWVKRAIPDALIHRLDLYTRISRKAKQKQEVSPQLRAAIIAHYSADIRLLSEVTDRNLDHWLQSERSS